MQQRRLAGSREAPGASGRGLACGCRPGGPTERAPETRQVSSAAGGGESRPARLRAVRGEGGFGAARQRGGCDASPGRQPAGRSGFALPASRAAPVPGSPRRGAAPGRARWLHRLETPGRLRRPSLLILTERRRLSRRGARSPSPGRLAALAELACNSKISAPVLHFTSAASCLPPPTAPLAASCPVPSSPLQAHSPACRPAFGVINSGAAVGRLSPGGKRIELF